MPSGRRSWLARLARRPVLTVSALGVVAAAVQVRWVAVHRHLGGYSLDESAYLANALRIARAPGVLPPHGPYGAVLDTPRLGPLVPLLSAAPIHVFGRTPHAALLVQAVLYLVTAVAVAAIVARTSTGVAAVGAGIVALGMPIALILARSYQLASGVTAFLALAVWALVASDRGAHRWRMVGFGAAVGAMLLSRTMAVAFVPGLAFGVVVLVRRTAQVRRVVENLGLAALACVAVAGPWWIAQWTSVTGYLFHYGYGQGTTEIAETPLLLRAPLRLGLAMLEARFFLVLPAIVLLVAASVSLVRHRRSAGAFAGWAGADRELAAVWVVVLVGVVALLSSSNPGDWFQSPLVVLSIAPIAAMAGRLAGGWERVVGSVAVAMAAASFVLVSTWAPLGGEPGQAGPALGTLAGTEGGQALDFDAFDARFAAGASWADRHQAERAWAAAERRLGRAVAAHERSVGPVRVTWITDLSPLNANSFRFQGELEPGLRFPSESISSPDAKLSGDVTLDPRAGARRRVLVAVVPADDAADDGKGRVALADARARGWRPVARIALPQGGQAVLLAHP